MATRRETKSRVILLLDLDCFYAQCETVRLGLDRSLPLCLLQWNSALAVNYPARELAIKRGDSFQDIQAKGKGRCVSLHLPVISVGDAREAAASGGGASASAAATAAATAAGAQPSPDRGGTNDEDARVDAGNDDGGEASLEETYDATFNLPQHVRDDMFKRERNVMRRPHEGKASLERYRLASARIFSVVTEALTDHVGKGDFVLERASIDELFLDITDHCYDTSKPAWSEGGGEGGATLLDSAALKETVVYGSDVTHIDEDDEETNALRRGCVVARGVRKAVYDALCFTMSAGCSTNKMVAKLAASHGKPDGQAVVFPPMIPELMDETKIRKVRNLGGKVGKRVMSLLPEEEETMGSIARLLSLADLTEALGRESGKSVFDAARGMDDELVTETKGALTKSITAFKSFPATSNLEGLARWINLLVTDIVGRVSLDYKRNKRYPRSCNIQYTYSGGDGTDRMTRSARISFPRLADSVRQNEQLVQRVKDTLSEKSNFPIHRLGLSAIDFEARVQNGAIDSYLSSLPKKIRLEDSSSGSNQRASTDEESTMKEVDKKLSQLEQDEELARQLQRRDGLTQTASHSEQNRANDPDLEYARKLQATYDRENIVLSTLERTDSSSTSSRKRMNHAGDSKKANRIDGFFTKKKKK